MNRMNKLLIVNLALNIIYHESDSKREIWKIKKSQMDEKKIM